METNNKLTEEVAKLKAKIVELEKQVKSKDLTSRTSPLWFPERNETYHYIDIKSNGGSEVNRHYYKDDVIDRSLIEIGNYFKTEAEANTMLERLKLMQEIRVWKSEHDPKSFDRAFIADHDYEKFYLQIVIKRDSAIVDFNSNFSWIPISPVGHFTSEYSIKEFIKQFGEERLLKLLNI